MYSISFLVLLLGLVHCGYGGGHKIPDQGHWKVTDGDTVCIKMEAVIKLNLTYIVKGLRRRLESNHSLITVPASAVSTGNCSEEVAVDGTTISSQTMTLTFDATKNPGWSMKLAFSKDKKVGAQKNEFVLWKVWINANYSSMNGFSDALGQNHTYEETVHLDKDDNDVSTLANAIYANMKYSYFCPSAQTYPIIKKSDGDAPAASVTFKNFRVQAYGDTEQWHTRETCPADEHVSDLVPVIVGGCLAGLVLVTLVAYLIYRWRLPPEVVHLTNPHSHFEDMAFDHHGHRKHSSTTEDDEEIYESQKRHSSGSQKRTVRLNGHVNEAYH
ncbi:hypothetical protein L596_021092 [Steinernema carpocapsae]|uniref:Uncharacterized protein n=1 Tax=Steinernema carpocapsae TaxID=34508 RepID=A0A4U5MVI9_STECR|nr:hypothetical protein L596_021092 [Steinernema carpocapsae]